MIKIDFKNLYKYDYLIKDVSIKDNFRKNDSYTCIKSGRKAHGLMFFKTLNTKHYFENQTADFKENDFIYFPKGLKYRSVFTKVNENILNGIIINFNLQTYKGEDFILSDTFFNIGNEINKKYEDDIIFIYNLIITHKPPVLIKAKLYELLTDISLNLNEKYIPEEFSKLNQGIRYIEKNFDKNITVSEIAKNAYLSESHFRRLFKKYMHISPLKYINNLKIKKADKMIKSGMYSISDISKAIGIDNPSYFSYFYKKETGNSPSKKIN